MRFNLACERLTGWRADEVIGRKAVDLVPPEQSDELLDTFRRVFAEVAAGGLPTVFDKDWFTKTGEQRTIAWRTTAMFGKGGEVSFVVAAGVDVTEQRELQRELDGQFSAIAETALLLQAQKEELEEANFKLQKLATTDGLTGALNHRTFYELLKEEWSHSVRDDTPLSLVLMDVDRFKRFNDDHGHVQGDNVLREVVALVQSACGPNEAVARYGGEEFALVLPQTEIEAASERAERMRALIEAHSWTHRNVTASFGVSSRETSLSPGEMVRRADAALYRAKLAGRNRVVSYNEMMAQEASSFLRRLKAFGRGYLLSRKSPCSAEDQAPLDFENVPDDAPGSNNASLK